MKIMILVNKSFEYRGYVQGVGDRMKAGATPNLHIVSRIEETDDKFSPLCLYELETSIGEKHTISEYCINNFFDNEKISSNSKIKHQHLTRLLNKLQAENNLPDYIISVSTSEDANNIPIESSEETSVNGCVFMGNKFYVKDCRGLDVPPRVSKLDVILQVLENKPIFDDFYELVKRDQNKLTMGMIALPNYPAKKLECIANPNDISLGVVNITNYKRYPVADRATADEFDNFNKDNKLNSVGIETTHAVVRMAAENNKQRATIPVLFVSPIVDRYLCFDIDVDGNWGEQNLKGSYNAGVVVANMLECFRNEFPIKFKEEE